MKLFFRQGIVRYQTDINAQPTFLQKSTLDSAFVDLIVSPDPTVIAFAHKNADYIFEEAKTVRKAWGPFTGTSTCYLYWDIDLLTGVLTRGFTLLPPIYSGTSPASPAADQHWFDTLQCQMRVWDGQRWIDKVRVFAAVYSSSAIIKGWALGSQAGLNVDAEGGNLVLDSFNKPLRQSDGSFVTTANNLAVVGVATKKVKFETEVLNLLALENIPKYSLVQVRPGRRCVLAKSTDRMSRVSGIATEDLYMGEVGVVVSAGLLRSDTWSWSPSVVNRPVFCGPNGELTTTVPTQGVLQQVGFVYDTDAVYINIFPSITLDHPDNISLPPAPPPPQAPIADFIAQPLITTGDAPFLVNFVNASTNSPTSYEWDFTNDGVVDATTPNASYTYVTPGVYNVRLRAINAYGADDEVKTGYITVTAPPATGTYTNLELKFEVNGHADTEQLTVKRGDLFQVKIKVRNDGYLTATNVQRVFIVHDAQGQQVVVSGLPPGATQQRVSNQYTKVTFPAIPSMISGAQVDVAFSLLAPPTAKPIVIEGAVSSPEVDSTTSDNTRSVTIQVKA
mgnify:CR=1 FL=1